MNRDQETVPEIVLPAVHLNGTSRGELVGGRCETARAVREAMEALARMAPNMRDYYGTGRWAPAMAQHHRREHVLASLYRELQEEAMAIADLEGGRP